MSQTEKLDYVTGGWSAEFTADLESFERLVRAAAAIVDECRMHVTPGGLRVSAVDPANVVMVETSMDGVETEDTVEVGVNLVQLVDAIETVYVLYEESTDPETLTIEIQPDNDEMVLLNHKDTRAMTFNPDSCRKEPDPPDLEYYNQFEIPLYKLRGLLGPLSEVATGHIRLNPENGELLVEADKGIGQLESRDFWEAWSVDVDVKEDEPTIYTGSYLKKIIDGLPAKGYATVSFSDDYPLRVETDGISYLLAPRITRD